MLLLRNKIAERWTSIGYLNLLHKYHNQIYLIYLSIFFLNLDNLPIDTVLCLRLEILRIIFPTGRTLHLASHQTVFLDTAQTNLMLSFAWHLYNGFDRLFTRSALFALSVLQNVMLF